MRQNAEVADICNCVEAMLHYSRNKAQPAAPNDKPSDGKPKGNP